jgi:SAM-dependent methyltransferase
VQVEWVRYVGWKLKCPICGWRFRSFAPDLWDGATWHGTAVRCPRCDSRPRHRWLALYLDRNQSVLRQKSVLHIAPEPMLAPYVERKAGDYVSADLAPERATVEADLTALPFDAERFDLVICSHVLEHVPDDHAAISEMHRVLRPGGLALVQTPVNYDQAGTYEDPAEADEAERLRRFSQVDHVRVFGPDLRERLAVVGFRVTIEDADELGTAAVSRYGLQANAAPLRNDIYRCERAVERTAA